MTASTDRTESLVQDIVQELLAGSVSDTALHILLFQFFEGCELRPEFCEVLVGAECVHICEYSVSVKVSRLVLAHSRRTVGHFLDFLPYCSLVVAEVDAVSERLAHLCLTVSSRQSHAHAVLWKKDFRLDQDLTINAVELSYYLSGLLDHRLLVFTCRNDCALECGDVSSLADRVAEESHGQSVLEISHLDFRLYRRISLESRYRYQIHVIECELCQLRNH